MPVIYCTFMTIFLLVLWIICYKLSISKQYVFNFCSTKLCCITSMVNSPLLFLCKESVVFLTNENSLFVQLSSFLYS